jgi:hypothetical protein
MVNRIHVAFKSNLRRYITVRAAGTFGNVCTDEGTFLSGSLTFAADLPIPFPDVDITAIKHCQPWIKEVLTIRASLDGAAWEAAQEAAQDNAAAAKAEAAAAAALGLPMKSSKKPPDYSHEKQPGKSPRAALGRAVQVDPIKPRVETAPGGCNPRLELHCVGSRFQTLLSIPNCAATSGHEHRPGLRCRLPRHLPHGVLSGQLHTIHERADVDSHGGAMQIDKIKTRAESSRSTILKSELKAQG